MTTHKNSDEPAKKKLIECELDQYTCISGFKSILNGFLPKKKEKKTLKS